jgi:hypothetical protein
VEEQTFDLWEMGGKLTFGNKFLISGRCVERIKFEFPPWMKKVSLRNCRPEQCTFSKVGSKKVQSHMTQCALLKMVRFANSSQQKSRAEKVQSARCKNREPSYNEQVMISLLLALLFPRGDPNPISHARLSKP